MSLKKTTMQKSFKTVKAKSGTKTALVKSKSMVKKKAPPAKKIPVKKSVTKTTKAHTPVAKKAKPVKKPAKVVKKVSKSATKAAKAAKTKVTRPTQKKVIKKVIKKVLKKPVKQVVKKKPLIKKTSSVKTTSRLKKMTVKSEPLIKLVSAPVTKPPKKSTPALQKEIVKAISKPKNNNHIGTMGVPPYQEKANEEYMNSAQLKHFRLILLYWKRQLMEEVDRTVHHMQDEAANFPDPNDRATQEEEFSLELRTRDRERKLIKKIDEAIQKIDSNNYGFCDACGIEIGIRRLEARPTATLCIDCKTLDEIKERQMGGGIS